MNTTHYFQSFSAPRSCLIALSLALAGCHAITDPRQEHDSHSTPAREESLKTPVATDQTRPADQAQPIAHQPVKKEPPPVPSMDVAGELSAESRQDGVFARKVMERAHRPLVMSAPATKLQHSQLSPGQGFPQNRENYHHYDDNPLKLVAEHPVSTFSIDVDTGSYSNIRRFINQGQLPQQDAVRVEELINYFNYDYEAPGSGDTPFAIHTEMAPSPWREGTVLLQVGLKGYEIPREQLLPANLVFLIDVSGSMNSPDKLGLLKQGFRLLTQQLRPEDSISIVVYAGASGTVLEPTGGDQKMKIQQAIEQLAAGGSTNGAAGIELAYQMAQSQFKKAGINRVILATDGDFNVGTVNFEALKDMVEQRRKTGISLTTLGFGTGNYNDHLMEQLADAGNGNYAYIDNLQEARKVLVEEMGSTLQTIASDVKIQIEFNPAEVTSYRLVGYENRQLNREDFNNDKVDAGEIGAGHTVTAIYELELRGGQSSLVDPLRYGSNAQTTQQHSHNEDKAAGELAFLKLRYKLPGQSQSRLVTQPLQKSQVHNTLDAASENFRFAAAVAGFGQLLRGGKYTGEFDYDAVATLGVNAKGADVWGYRSEFINLVRLARHLAQ
ncbi:MAG: VWA domain-containing protein [Ketobacteraceae bacterium]|nr:VWA domain-containing protein [Ketobacteraceae bacterium]